MTHERFEMMILFLFPLFVCRLCFVVSQHTKNTLMHDGEAWPKRYPHTQTWSREVSTSRQYEIKIIHQMFVPSPGRLMLCPQLFLTRFGCCYLCPLRDSIFRSRIKFLIIWITRRINPFAHCYLLKLWLWLLMDVKLHEGASWAGSCEEIQKLFFTHSAPQKIQEFNLWFCVFLSQLSCEICLKLEIERRACASFFLVVVVGWWNSEERPQGSRFPEPACVIQPNMHANLICARTQWPVCVKEGGREGEAEGEGGKL